MFPFELFQIMFFLVFILVLGIFAVIFFRGIKHWNKNNQSACWWRATGAI